MKALETVEDYIQKLQEFPKEWKVIIEIMSNLDILMAHRELDGEPIVLIFNSNGGGHTGEIPLTEEVYKEKSERFLYLLLDPYIRYTSIHGDHQLYRFTGGGNDTCYGYHFDRRIIERMVEEGLIPRNSVDIDRVRRFDGVEE